jgi:hypothetical protein
MSVKKVVPSETQDSDVGERIGEHLLDLISGGDGGSTQVRPIDIGGTGGGSGGIDFAKATWRRAF